MQKKYQSLKNIRPSWRIFLFYTCLLNIGILTSQTYYFDNYSVRQGLGQSKVYAIIQDKDDYIWMGTQSGATRFDGIYFENYTQEQGLAGNGIRSIIQDEFGNIWFGHTGGGVTRFDGKDFEVITLFDTIMISNIVSVLYDENTGLWITSDGSGAILINNPMAPANELKYTHFTGKNGLSDRAFQCTKFPNDSIYLITDVGIKKYNSADTSFENFDLKGMPRYFQPTCILQGRNKNIWIGTHNGGLYHYIYKEESFEFYEWLKDGLAHNFISTLFEDVKGRLWVGTWGGGISLVDKKKIKNFDITNGLQDEKIRCFVQDAEGNILIGTNEHGLSIFKGEHFVSYNEKDGLINKQVWAINQDEKGRYWFGTNGGITVYDPQKEENGFTHYTPDKDFISNQIRFIRKDNKDNIWVGTEDNGVYIKRKGENRLIFHTSVNRYMPNLLIVTAMEIDSKQTLWIGTIDGVIYYDIENESGDRYTQYYGIAGNEISALYLDNDETLWIGSKAKGVTIRKKGDESKFQILEKLKNITPISFIEDQEGKMWIATEGNGVLVYYNDSIIKHLTVEDGLLANLINLLNIDEENNIYIGTNKGLNKYNQKEDKIYTYTIKNGFVGIETKINATYTDHEQNIWFGTVNGVMKYNYRLDREDIGQPLTHITRMRINLKERPMVDNLKLNYKENSIIFDYHSICLTNPEAVEYQIKLEGADQTWQPVTKQTMASYTALPPGKYIFKVKGKNSTGEWNKEPISYAFQIKPPFYKTWWFILTCIVVGLISLFLYIKIRERNLIREKRILEEKVRERTIEITRMNEELAMKNKDITDSIEYAKRIQFAMLSPDIPFDNAFIMFKPKDIVSGDFYWLLEHKGKQFFAAVDCTGHGVPGAFMSIIGHNSLDKIVKEYGITEPGKILTRLNQEVTVILHQQETEGLDSVKDGMDLALTCYNPYNKTLEYAGAYNPLILVRNGEVIETKGDKFAIGKSDDSVEKNFTNHTIKIEKDDSIFLFSDGYADQFGGEKGKKFMIRPLKNMLVAIAEKSANEQKEMLDNTIEAWKSGYEQIDDILIMGRKF